MFKRSDPDSRQSLHIFVDGAAVEAREGDTVSAALLACGRDVRRSTAVSGAPRLPYCMMGVCFDCLVTIDGVGNRQGCLVPVAIGLWPAQSFYCCRASRPALASRRTPSFWPIARPRSA